MDVRCKILLLTVVLALLWSNASCCLQRDIDDRNDSVCGDQFSLLQVAYDFNDAAKCSASTLLLFGGYTTDGNGLDTVYSLDLSVAEPTWQQKASLQMPHNRMGNCGVAHDSKFYVLGNLPPERGQSVEILDLLTNTWSEGPDLPTGRAFASCVLLNEKIYVIGSMINEFQGSTNAVEILNLTTLQWETGPALPGSSCASGQSIVHGEEIYVMGCGDIPGNTTEVRILDTVSGTWRAGPDMPEGRTDGIAQKVAGNVYFFSGFSDQPPYWPYAEAVKSAYMLNLSTQQWSALPSVPSPTACPSSAVYGQHIYLLGGESKHMYPLNGVTIFNTVTREYRSGPPLPVNISDSSAGIFLQC